AGPTEARISVDNLGAAARTRTALGVVLSGEKPLEADWMRLGRVGAIDQDEVGVLDIAPVVCHRPPPECGGQTDHRGAVSNPCLLFEMDQAGAAHHLGGEVPFLAGGGGATGEGNPLRTVDGVV